MAEIERNPLAVRQGAAAVACIAAAAVAMPVISHRAAEQRDGAQWASHSAIAQLQASRQYGEPNARIELTSYRTTDGLRARGSASLFAETMDAHALLVQAALRGPLAPAMEAAPARPMINANELNCLSEAVYYEARGESYTGQIAVAEVVMNRVKSKLYPKTVCGVVYQGSTRVDGCQFTFTCDGSAHRRPRGGAWDRAQQIAAQVIGGYARQVTAHATHYHTSAVDPIWSSGLVETTRIGSHVFYRFPNSAERPALMQAMMRRRAALGARGGDDVQDGDDDLIPQANVAAQGTTTAPTTNAAAPTTPASTDAPVTAHAPSATPSDTAA